MISKGGFFRQEPPTVTGVAQPHNATKGNHRFAQQLNIFGDLQTAQKFPSVVVP